MTNFIYLVLSCLLILPGQALAQVKICKIKYGLAPLEKRNLTQSILRSNNNDYPHKCIQIGLEHDEFRRPIPSKPIYACCRDAKGREAIPDYLFETE